MSVSPSVEGSAKPELVRLPSGALISVQDDDELDDTESLTSTERNFTTTPSSSSPFKRFARLAMTPTTRVIMNVARVQRREAQLRMRAPKGMALLIMLVAHVLLLIPVVLLPLMEMSESFYLSDVLEGLKRGESVVHLAGILGNIGSIGLIVGRMLLWTFGMWFGHQRWLAFARDLSPWVCMPIVTLSSAAIILPGKITLSYGYQCLTLYCALSTVASVLSCPPSPGFSHSTLGPRKSSRILFCFSTTILVVVLAKLMSTNVICVSGEKTIPDSRGMESRVTCFTLFELVSSDRMAWGGWLSISRLGVVWTTFSELVIWVSVAGWPPLRPRVRRALLMLRYGVIFEPMVVLLALIWAASGESKHHVAVESSVLLGLVAIAVLLQVVRWCGMRYLKDYTNQLSPSRNGQPFDFEIGFDAPDGTDGWTMTEEVDEFALPPADMQEVLACHTGQGRTAAGLEAPGRSSASAE